jgi:hypothetical protein
MKLQPSHPSPEYLRACFSYDADTGALTWKCRPPAHFANSRAAANFNGKFAGCVAGSVDHGYLRVSLSTPERRFFLYGHRIAWCLVHNEWPDGEVDHRDLDGTNNRISNLRIATSQQNRSNCLVRKHNKLGVKGVQACPNSSKFAARISINGRNVHLGTFHTIEEAAAAFATASASARGEFARTGAAV